MTTSNLSAISPDDGHRVLARHVLADGVETDIAPEIVHKSRKEL